MKKHARKTEAELFEQLVREFQGVRGVRFLSIVTHLYLDYFVNELICREFGHPEEIIDGKVLGEFNNKFALLKARGFFDDKLALEKNVALLTRIRNHYAHNLSDEGVPEEVEHRVLELNELPEFAEQPKFFEVFKVGNDLEDAFRVRAIQTILVLAKES